MNTAIIKPQWGPLTIALMVLGFIVWWPLGLAMLAYILWGEHFGGSAEKAGHWVNKQKAWAENCKSQYRGHSYERLAPLAAAMPRSMTIAPSSCAGSKRSAAGSTRRSRPSTSTWPTSTRPRTAKSSTASCGTAIRSPSQGL